MTPPPRGRPVSLLQVIELAAQLRQKESESEYS